MQSTTEAKKLTLKALKKKFGEVYLIKEPYWTAGRKFGWTDEYSMPGIGIRLDRLYGEGIFYCRVMKSAEAKGKVYAIDRLAAKRFAKAHQAVYDARLTTRLIVIPWSMFEVVYDPNATAKPNTVESVNVINEVMPLF